VSRDGIYNGTASSFQMSGDEIVLPEKTWTALQLSEGEEIFFSPL
jgi:hypothetical protein